MSMRGSDLSTVIRIAHELNFATRALRIELDGLRDLVLPAILHWDLEHFVVIVGIRSDEYLIHDPAQGILRLSPKVVGDHFTGVALELTSLGRLPNASDPSAKLGLRDVFAIVPNLIHSLVLVGLLTLTGQFLLLGLPLFSRAVVDHVIGQEAWAVFPHLLGAWVLAVGVQLGLDAIRGRVALHFDNAVALQARISIFRHLLSLPVEYFQRRQVADVQQKFRSLDEVLSIITDGFVTVILDGFFCVVGLSLAFVYSPEMAAVALIPLTLLAVVTLRSVPRQNALTDRWVASWGKESGLLLESIRAAQTIKMLGAEAHRVTQFANSTVSAANEKIALAAYANYVNAVALGIQGTAQIIGWAFGATLIRQGKLSLGSVVAFQAYLYLVITRFHASMLQFARMKSAKIYLERVADIVLESSESESMDGSETSLERIDGRIQLSSVRYAYSPSDPPVLNGIDLCVDVGECVAIIGPSGGGKTTLLKIIAGALRPSSGTVKIDGKALSGSMLRSYRGQLGAVMQNDELFAGSLLHNIIFPEASVDEVSLQRALEQAQISDVIRKLPMGLHSAVGDMGSILSAGQRQRALLARALYRNPTVLLLDEATGDMDLETERKVVDALGSLSMTRVVITHRPEILRIANRVARLAEGELVWLDSSTLSRLVSRR